MSSESVHTWLECELTQFAARRPRSRALFAAGEEHYLHGAPMHWMRRWPGGFPLYAARAVRTCGAWTASSTWTSAWAQVPAATPLATT
jgi:hypothetical protein